MKRLLLLLLFTSLSLTALAQDNPVLSLDGLEEFKLGQKPPTNSQFEGLTFQRNETTEMAEGEEYRMVTLKFYLNGHYLGKARLDDEGRIDEFRIVDPLVRYEGGFAVGSTWDEIQRVFPRVELHYTYVMDKILAESPPNPGFQVLFETSQYSGKSKLEGEFQQLSENDLKAEAPAEALRLYWVKK